MQIFNTGKVCLLFALLLFCVNSFSQTTKTSITTGNWNNPSTWDSGVPVSGDNVVIDSGHTVTMNGNHVINDVTVRATARLDDNGKRPNITGNLILNGTFISTGRPDFIGTGATIDGIGTFSCIGGARVTFLNNKTILSSANLTFSDDGNSRFRVFPGGTVITNNGTITIDGNRFEGPGTWTNNTNSTLRVGGDRFNVGTLNASASGNTVEYYGSAAQEVKCPTSSTYYHLTISGTSTKTMFCNIIIDGNLTLNSGTLDADAANNYSINIKGNWNNQGGTFNEQNATVTFDGTGAQSLTNSLGETFFNLTIDKSGGTLTLNGNAIVNGAGASALTMTQGNIDASSGTLRLGIADEGSLNRASGTVIGKFERYINNSAPATFLFPVGTASDYRPATLTFNALSAGHLICEFVESDPGNNGLSLFDSPDSIHNTFVEGYWSFTPGSGTPLGSVDYDVNLTGNGFTSFTINPSTRILRRGTASQVWEAQGTHIAATAPTAERNTIATDFPAQHAFGDTTNCAGPSTGSISGDNDVCTGDLGESYLVTNTPGSNYTWTITGGTQASGGTTNSITVDWDGAGMVGNVRVVENNGCTNGAPVDLAVSINTIAPASLTGKSSVPEFATGGSYSVTASPGYTYTWTITGGTQASGGTTNSITVNWGAAGSGNVRVVANSSCGSTPPVDLPVNIYVVINSIAIGNWNATTTWDCSCVPLVTDNVIIQTGHTVSLVANTQINNLTINNGGIFNPNGNDMTVAGNFEVNGDYAGGTTGHVLTLSGIGTTIDGIGTISSPGTVLFNTGSKTIVNTASITKNAGNFTIDGITVTNNGSITIGADLVGNNPSSIWTNATSSTLNIGGVLLATGTLNASATGNTVNYNGASAQSIKLPSSSTYYHFTTSGGDIKTLPANLDINGDLTITGTSQLDVASYDISIAGNWTNSSGNANAFNEQSQSVTFDGENAQTLTNLSGETFFNLTTNKSSGILTLNDNVTVTNTLTMSAGNIGTGTDTLMLGTSVPASGTLTHTSGTIDGIFRKWVDVPGTYLMPVGTSADYRPASVVINTLTSGGSLTAQFNNTSPGENGIPLVDIGPGDSIRHTLTEGSWDLMPANGMATSNYDIDLTGNGFTSFSITAGTRIMKRSVPANPWTVDGSHLAASGNRVRRTGLTGGISAQFGLGDTSQCTVPITSPITGLDSVCTGATGSIYSVVDSAGSTYTWTVAGGIIVSGQTTDSISVNWGTTGMVGNVRVEEYNGCGSGAPVNLAVNIHTLPTSSISGFDNVAEFTDSVAYTVTANTGYTYTWTITGGTIILGQGTDNILVNWGSAGSGNVRVVGSTSCGPATAVDLPVAVYTTIKSNGTGNWTTPASWDCNCVPQSTDNVIIQGDPLFHTIILTSNTTINNIIIEDGATLFDNAFSMTVNGDLTINGTGIHLGSGNLILSGVDKIIDGTGRIATTGTVMIQNGDKTLPAGASINRSPGNVSLGPGITVTNNGSLIVAGNITGAALSSTFTNNSSSTLIIGGDLLITGTLNASSTDNTIRYNGSGAQNVKPTIYYNLSSTGISTTTLTTNLIVNGDVVISATNTFSTNGFNMNVKGNWTNSGGTFTASTGTVTFDGSGTQTITNTAGEQFNHLTISNTSILQTAGASDNINLSGDWTNNGTFMQQSGTVTFNGGGAQSIGGSTLTSFNDLTINKSAGTATLSSAQNLIGTLTLTSGTLNTGGQDFTLISTSSATANIAEITGGDITGDIIMQRYFAAGNTGYHFLSTPVSGISLNDWDQEMVLSIPNGINGLACNGSWCFYSVKFYNEPMPGLSSVGYDSLGSIGNSITEGLGYWVYTGTGQFTSTAYTIDSRGPANKNFAPIDVTHTVSGGDTEDGWNLIGNPYPSDVNWDLVTLSGTVTPFGYVWDPNGSSYVSFDQSSGFALASHQAVWVKVAEGGAGTHSETVTFDESDKTTDGNNFLKTGGNPNPQLLINLEGAGYNMSTEVRFNQDATEGYDWQLDAYHLNSLVSDAPNLSTVTTNGPITDLSINSVLDLSQNISIPIRINWLSAGVSDTYTLSVDMESIPQSSCVLLEDLWPPYSVTDLRQDTSVTFAMVQAKNMPPHFMLHIGAQAVVSAASVSCNGADDGTATSTGQGTGPWVYTWLDQGGDTVSGPSNVNGPDNIDNLAPGIYTVYTSAANSICQSAFEEISITEPPLLAGQATQEDVSCFGESDGNIYLTINGGTTPYNFNWSNGNNLKDNLEVTAGLYTVSITDANNCSFTNSYIITEPSEIIANAVITNISCFGNDDGIIMLDVSGGNGLYSFLWNDGATDEDITNLQAGIYGVQITDNDNCSVMASGLIVEEGLQLTAGFSTSSTGNPGELQFNNLSTGALSYFWDFGDGKTSTTENPIHMFPEKGTYTVTLNITNGTCSNTRSDLVIVTNDPVGIENIKDSEKNIHIYVNGSNAFIEFNFNESMNVSIKVFNIIGQKIYDYGNLIVKDDNIVLPLSDLDTGIYLISIETVNNKYIEKIAVSD